MSEELEKDLSDNKEKYNLLKKINDKLAKKEKWIDWIFFVILLGILSPVLHWCLLFFSPEEIICDDFCAEFCFFSIILLSDTVRNTFFDKTNELKALKLLTACVSFFSLFLVGYLYFYIIYNIYIENTNVFNFVIKLLVMISCLWGIGLNWFSVRIKENA